MRFYRCIKLLLKHTDRRRFITCDSSPIEHALLSNATPVLQTLIDSGIDPNFSHHCDFLCENLFYRFGHLNILEYDSTAHPLTLACLFCDRHVQSMLDVLYDAGSDCSHIRCPMLSPLLPASQKCTLGVYKTLVLRGHANINLYHHYGRGNVVLLYALPSYAKLFWLLQCGAECDSLLNFNLATGHYEQVEDSEVGTEPDHYLLTLYGFLSELNNLKHKNVVDILLLLFHCSHHVHALDSRLERLFTNKDGWKSLLQYTSKLILLDPPL